MVQSLGSRISGLGLGNAFAGNKSTKFESIKCEKLHLESAPGADSVKESLPLLALFELGWALH